MPVQYAEIVCLRMYTHTHTHVLCSVFTFHSCVRADNASVVRYLHFRRLAGDTRASSDTRRPAPSSLSAIENQTRKRSRAYARVCAVIVANNTIYGRWCRRRGLYLQIMRRVESTCARVCVCARVYRLSVFMWSLICFLEQVGAQSNVW